MGNTFPTNVAQNPTPPSMGPQHQPHSRSCPPFPVQPDTTHVGHRGANGIQIQTHRPLSIPIPYSRTPQTPPAATTVQWWSEPPPLQLSKSPYCRVPLPEMTRGPVKLNPILAYSYSRELNVTQRRAVDVRHHRHICTPATNPSLGTLTVLLPNGQGIITVHAPPSGHSFVTVGDVLNALDTAFLGRSSTEVSPIVEGMDGDQCACQNETTALRALRSRYERAGLMRNEEGFDIWDLRIG
jgi:hypothetical protein